MGKKSRPEQIKLTAKQVKNLEVKLQNNQLEQEDVNILISVLTFYLWLQEQLSKAKLTITRLKKIFGFKREKLSKSSGVEDTSPTDEQISPNEDGAKNNIPQTKKWDANQNHGRYGAADYTGCNLVSVSFSQTDLVNGGCPDCQSMATPSKLYSLPPKVLVLLDSQPLVFGTRYELETARCSVCQQYLTASLPKPVKTREKYSPSCKTAIAIYHYYAGIPFKRLEMLQKAQGVPLSDATQFELMKKLYKSVISPIADALRQLAANGHTVYFDDTPGRILEQTSDNRCAKSSKNKRGVYATALLSEYESHRIYLFDTNTSPAGKQLQKLLNYRTTSKRLLTMSDASAMNFPELDDTLMARWVISLCLSHGRRRFVELLSGQDEDLLFVLELIAKVYINERHCQELGYNQQQRLSYHQQHSGPVMAALFTWFNNLLLFKQVEPNSRFGEAILYMIKRWDEMTAFLHVAGAPLDNNICEQSIKVLIRYRNNSKFYRTFYGASVGDSMMSVIHTASRNGCNIFDYLNTLQQYQDEVLTNPMDWLPWNYQSNIDSS